MKIVNHGRGIHAREVPGIDYLQRHLPGDWVAHTNLDLSLPQGGPREIDVILFGNDRIYLVDLKDGHGRYESAGGDWSLNGKNQGRSPVKKILENARQVMILLGGHLEELAKRTKHAKLPTPRIDAAVVLTSSTDLTGIASTEMAQVFTIRQFVETVTDTRKRLSRFAPVPSAFVATPVNGAEWKPRLERFFNVRDGLFKEGMRHYGGYVTVGPGSPSYSHPSGIYHEFTVQDDSAAQATGLLRRWDFSMADTRFQTEDGRGEIAGRERNVVAWLNDRSPDCESAVMQIKAFDPESGVESWEVFDRRRRMKRMSEFATSELPGLRPSERITLAQQLLFQMSTLHSYDAAHLNIGAHSVWVDLPTVVRLSHLMTARYPEANSLGESRYQFLSSVQTPEDALGASSTYMHKDVYHIGLTVHLLLFGQAPKESGSYPAEWDPCVDSEKQYVHLHGVLQQSLAWDPEDRFANAIEMLEAFNSACERKPSGAAILRRLDRFSTISSQMALFRKYPLEGEPIRDDSHLTIWHSVHNEGPVVVKMWKRSCWSDGDSDYARILDFLERANELSLSTPPNCVAIRDAIWLRDAIVVVTSLADGDPLSHMFQPYEARSDAVTLRCLAFLRDLAQSVNAMHEAGIAHGDLNPGNIVVSGDGQIRFIDYHDFSCEADGERLSSEYSPTRGGRFERDRFAVTVVAEKLFQKDLVNADQATAIASAIDECRSNTPGNATLLPFLAAIEAALLPSPTHEMRRITIGAPGLRLQDIRSDEGIFGFGFNGRDYFLRGATHTINLSIRDRKVMTLSLNEISHLTARSLSRKELGVLELEISTEPAPTLVCGELENLFLEAPLAALLESHAPIEASNDASEEDDQDQDALDLTTAETSEDAVDDIPSPREVRKNVGTAALWRRLVEVEKDLTIEAVALDPSVFLKDKKSHVAPIRLEQGILEFHRNDRVYVERLSGQTWRRIGLLDVSASSDALIHVESTDSWPSAHGPLIDADQRIRFQSHMEQANIDRRVAAINRILSRQSTIRNLLDHFDPSSPRPHEESGIEVDRAEVMETYGLNATQAEAFAALFRVRPLGLLQGPPGTGKTKFIGAMIHYALSKGHARNVLLASQSHEAVNNAAEALLRLYPAPMDAPSVIRVGQEPNVSERLLPFHVARVEQQYKDTFRASARERLLIAARSIGITSEAAESLALLELTVRPLIDQINALANDKEADGSAARIQSLSQSLQTLSLHHQLAILVPEIDELPAEGLYEETVRKIASDFGQSQEQTDRFRSISRLARDIIGSVSTAERSFETFLAGTRNVVAGTCVGLGRSSLGLTSTSFDLVVIDEAARSSASELAVPMQAGRWVVLVGDQAQLEPSFKEDVVRKVSEETGIDPDDVIRSDFEKVFSSPRGREIGATLSTQYRMLGAIGDLVSNSFYKESLRSGRTAPVIGDKALPPSLSQELAWIVTDEYLDLGYQSQQVGRSRKSLINNKEAEVIVSLISQWDQHPDFLEWIKSRDSADHTIGIICMYSGQAIHLRNKLRMASISHEMQQQIKIDTVDSYQGKENPIVILSLVRNNADAIAADGSRAIRSGFMRKANRINVAISRAMDRLVIVGAKSRWRADEPMGKVSANFDKLVDEGRASLVPASEAIKRLWLSGDVESATAVASANEPVIA
jgi:serine/threonine protein kinase